MKLTSDDIKAAVASYWRYTRQSPIVAFEYGRLRWGGELADIVAVNNGHLIVVEVKTSVGDFRRDRLKYAHRYLRNNPGTLPIKYFYFAVPLELANKISLICDQLYPYAGVLGCQGLHDYDVSFHRDPKKLECVELAKEDIEALTRSQTATLCRLAMKVAESKQSQKRLESQLKVYKDQDRLEEG